MIILIYAWYLIWILKACQMSQMSEILRVFSQFHYDPWIERCSAWHLDRRQATAFCSIPLAFLQGCFQQTPGHPVQRTTILKTTQYQPQLLDKSLYRNTAPILDKARHVPVLGQNIINLILCKGVARIIKNEQKHMLSILVNYITSVRKIQHTICYCCNSKAGF